MITQTEKAQFVPVPQLLRAQKLKSVKLYFVSNRESRDIGMPISPSLEILSIGMRYDLVIEQRPMGVFGIFPKLFSKTKTENVMRLTKRDIARRVEYLTCFQEAGKGIKIYVSPSLDTEER